MSQDQWQILIYKIVLISGDVSLAAWIAVYSWLAPWWRNPIGRTLVIKSLLIMLAFVPFILSLFFQFNRADSRIAGWVDVGFLGAVTPVMLWRVAVWLKLGKAGRLPRNGDDGLAAARHALAAALPRPRLRVRHCLPRVERGTLRPL